MSSIFLDGYSRNNHILIAPEDKENTMFIIPYGTYAFICMPFKLRNAPMTFQKCMMVTFHYMVKDIVYVFMDYFSIFGMFF